MTEKYILVDGEPVEADLYTWAQWIETRQREKIVQQDYIGGVKVSTVFLGLNHNWGDGPPILWETMIFGGPHDQYQERYASTDAVIGHQRALRILRGEEAAL